MGEGCPPQSASGVSRCRPCLALQILSAEKKKKHDFRERGVKR